MTVTLGDVIIISIGLLIVVIGMYATYIARRAYKTATTDLNRLIDIIDKMAGIYNEEQNRK